MSDDRKKDHINLAIKSVPEYQFDLNDTHYEPLFSSHIEPLKSTEFLGESFDLPLWISSMTGGTALAEKINENLALACAEFGLGMGLGSCRPLLESNERLADFDIRGFMPARPLYTNFGIAQLEELIDENNLSKIDKITEKLSANGIIIHVNPLQEWAQPEGDQYKRPAIETIETVLNTSKYPIIVKEVGQGFGPKSLETLVKLPLAAIELAGFGGTNFTILEQARHPESESGKYGIKETMAHVGHTPEQMIYWLNNIAEKCDLEQIKCKNIIISGGVKDPLLGMSLMKSLDSEFNCVFGMASQVLKYSMGEYSELRDYLLEVKNIISTADKFIK